MSPRATSARSTSRSAANRVAAWYKALGRRPAKSTNDEAVVTWDPFGRPVRTKKERRAAKKAWDEYDRTTGTGW